MTVQTPDPRRIRATDIVAKLKYEVGKDPVVPEFPKMEAAGGGNISDLGGYFVELKYFVDRVLSGEPFEVVTPQTSRRSLELTLEEIAQIKSKF